MIKKIIGSTTLVAVLASFAVLAGAGNAMAQGTSTESITVYAPYITHQKKPANGKGTVYSVLSMLGTASYSDLDLSKASDGAVLKERVRDTAKKLCDTLKAKYPEAVYVPVSPGDCVKTATDESMETVNLLISAYAKP
jgi:UrcA family protein